MTHEPDIIREAERVLKSLDALREHEEESGSVGLLSFGDMTMSVEDAAAAVRQAYAALPSMHDIANTPLHGLDNPEPTVRVAADEQRDYGDEDRNA